MPQHTLSPKRPDMMSFTLDVVVATHFRNYCRRNHLVMGGILEDAVIDFLIEQGEIESRESLAVEKALTK